MRVGTFAAVGAVAFLVIGNHVAPWEPPASYSRGVAALAMKQLEDAEKWLSRAIEEDPGFWRAYRDLGECLLRGERPREAVEVLERAVDLEPRDERTQALLSDARSELSSLPNDEDDVPPAVAVEAVQTPMPTRPLGDFARRPPPDGPARTYVITGSPGAAEQETVAGGRHGAGQWFGARPDAPARRDHLPAPHGQSCGRCRVSPKHSTSVPRRLPRHNHGGHRGAIERVRRVER